MKYNHEKIEKKWQKEWEKKQLYKTQDTKEESKPFDKAQGKENFYALVEFPYPSGNLHAGHWYAFSVPDIFVRLRRMQGYDVMFPIGFDAFGLPAENAAIKRKLNPRTWTESNIAYMRKQLRSMGASFDWSRETVTCDPDYYRWTQWIFLQFFKKGLAYQAETPVNWCPKDKTVLANEQVVAGRCERCGGVIEQRMMKQWMLKITDYAEQLLKGLDKLNWPEEIKEAQRNWIGKSEGAEIDFLIRNFQFSIKVFTTRPDTLFGATYIVLAPEHEAIQKLKSKIKNWEEVKNYIKTTQSKTELERQQGEKDKTGVELKGVRAINPATKEDIPIFIADYVLAHYGTGAIMAVPAHDERDFKFAKKFKLSIRYVVSEENRLESGENVQRTFSPSEPANDALDTAQRRVDEQREKSSSGLRREENNRFYSAYIGNGILINSGKFNGMKSEDAKRTITEFVGGKMTSRYRLRDWVLSRQRYWGTPIPVVHCRPPARLPDGQAGGCGVVAVPEKDLPVKLPDIKDYLPTGDGKSPLAKAMKWVKTKCPKCGSSAERETDTMDTFVDSSWYFLRYCDPHNKKKFADAKKMRLWMPVDRYSGGAEHTTMHLLYSRFWMKAMHDCGFVELDEPYAVRMNRGIILGPDGQKMSKSRGNVVDPDEYVTKLGADTVRMYLAFIGPYSEVGSYPWDPRGILGIRRFLDRIWALGQKLSIDPRIAGSPPANWRAGDADSEIKQLERLLHKTIKKVTEDIEAFRFNTAISQLMIFFNEMEKFSGKSDPPVGGPDFQTFLKLLAPLAPHLAEELWQRLGNPIAKSIHQEPWPRYNPKLIEDETFELVIQINGKVRDKVKAPIDISQKEAEVLTFSREKVKNILGANQPRRVIFIPKRLINLVV